MAITKNTGIKSFSLSWKPSSDLDVAGYLVACVPESGLTAGNFTPSAGNIINDGPETSFVYFTPTGGKYYFKIAAYDSWEDREAINYGGLNWTALDYVDVPSNDVLDTTPPAIPTGITLVSAIDRVSQTTTSYIRASWNANIESDFDSYILQLRKISEAYFYEVSTKSTEYKFDGLIPGVAYGIKIKGQDKYGNTSAFGTEVSITTAANVSAPATPTGLSVTAGLKKVIVSFNKNTEADLAGYEIHVSTSANFTPSAGTLKASGLDTLYSYDGAAATTYYVKVRAYNWSGTFSTYTSAASATTAQVGTSDIAVGAVTADHITATNMTALAAKFNTADIKNAAIESIDAGKINTGSLSATTAIYVGDSKVKLDGTNKRITINDGTRDRVILGNLGTSYGIDIKNNNGDSLFFSDGNINGAKVSNLVVTGDQLVGGTLTIGGATFAYANGSYGANQPILNSALTPAITTAQATADSALTKANTAISDMTNPFFEQGTELWSNYYGQPLGSNITVATNGLFGGKTIVVADNTAIYSTNYIPVNTSRVYKCRIRVRQTVKNGNPTLYVGVVCYDSNKNLLTVGGGSYNYCTVLGVSLSVAAGWSIFEGTITGAVANSHSNFGVGTAYVKVVALLNYGGVASDICEVDSLEFYDITESVWSNIPSRPTDAELLNSQQQWSAIQSIPYNVSSASAGVTLYPSAGVTVAGNTVKKTSASTAWDVGAYSFDSYTGAVAVSFKAGQTDKHFMAGINTINDLTYSSYQSIDYCWYLLADGSCAIYESGSAPTGGFGYTTDTVFSIICDCVSIKYYMDGVLKYTANTNSFSNDSTRRWFFDCSIYTPNAEIKGITISPASNNLWSDIGGTGKPYDNADSTAGVLGEQTTLTLNAPLSINSLLNITGAAAGITSGLSSYNQANTTGFWVSKDTGTSRFRVGTIDGSGNLTNGLLWNGSTLTVRGTLNANDILASNVVIGTANIGTASVDTLQVKGQAITMPMTLSVSTTNFTNVNSVTHTLTTNFIVDSDLADNPMIVIASGEWTRNLQSTQSMVRTKVYIGGILIGDWKRTANEFGSSTVLDYVYTTQCRIPAGTYSISVIHTFYDNVSGAIVNMTGTVNTNLSILGAKR